MVRGSLPETAQLKFRGKVFDVYQWDQELYNGTTTTFEKLKRRDTVTVLALTEDEKILITRQEQPGTHEFLCLAGGVVDDGETPRQAVERELLEETGYHATEFELWFSVQPLFKIIWNIHTYVARGCTKIQAQQLDGGEKIEVELVTFDQFIEHVASGQMRDHELTMRILQEYYKDHSLAQVRSFLFRT